MTETDGTLKLAGNLKYGIRRAFSIERKTNLQIKSQEYGYYATGDWRKPKPSWESNIISTEERPRALFHAPGNQFTEVKKIQTLVT